MKLAVAPSSKRLSFLDVYAPEKKKENKKLSEDECLLSVAIHGLPFG